MQIKPFKAFRFDKAVVGDVGSCIAPPYDVISDDQQEQLYKKNEYNIVRIIRGKTNTSDNDDNNQYTRAAGYLNKWIRQGALKQDSKDAIYAYVQDFEISGTQFQRLAFIAMAKLEEFGEIVRPHEQILNKPMLDRLSLKKATKADFGLVFMLYEDYQEIADKIMEQMITTEPLVDFTDEQNVRHRLFTITAEDDIRQIVNMMKTKSCVIADGHHRYTTGLTYSKESDNPAAKYQMLAFSNISHKGLMVLATHRLTGNLENFSFEKLITDLEENFDLTEFKFDSTESKTDARQKMLAKMKAEHDNDKNAFGIYGANNAFYVAVLKNKQMMDSITPDMSSAWRTLDLSVLHKLILEKLLGIDEEKLAKGENLQYVKDTPNAIDESISQVDSRKKQAAFFTNPVKMQQLKLVTDAGERMPQKATYFYPKIFTGLTIQKL
ncbi:MAG: DUF1015 domain-containing protein [Sedimentisphaerales bacterium]|nr:DUF1015 domain-containing protein [Sedimentisphaerales bacterium]